MQGSFVWTVVVFVYNLYLVLKMMRAGHGLFNPNFFLDTDKGEDFLPGFDSDTQPTYDNVEAINSTRVVASPFVNPVFDAGPTATTPAVAESGGRKKRPSQPVAVLAPAPLELAPDGDIAELAQPAKTSRWRAAARAVGATSKFRQALKAAAAKKLKAKADAQANASAAAAKKPPAREIGRVDSGLFGASRKKGSSGIRRSAKQASLKVGAVLGRPWFLFVWHLGVCRSVCRDGLHYSASASTRPVQLCSLEHVRPRGRPQWTDLCLQPHVCFRASVLAEQSQGGDRGWAVQVGAPAPP